MKHCYTFQHLFSPHKCPDPKAKNSAPTNFTSRVSRRAMALGNAENVRLDRRLVHSRFCPVKTFRLGDEDGYFTCCEFLVRTFSGVIIIKKRNQIIYCFSFLYSLVTISF